MAVERRASSADAADKARRAPASEVKRKAASIGKGFLLLSVAQVVFMASGYLIHFFLGRSLGPEEYGVYGLIISMITIVTLFLTSGMPQAVAKSIAQKGKAQATLRIALRFQLLFSLVVLGLYAGFSKAIAQGLNDPSLAPLIACSALVIPFYATYAVLLGYFNGVQDHKRQTLMIIVYSVAKLLLIVALAWRFGAMGAIWGFTASPVLALLYGLHHRRKREARSKAYPFAQVKLLPLVKVALPVLGFTVLTTLLINMDLMLVKRLLQSNILTGYYNAASVLSKIPYFLLTSLGVVLLPSIARLYADDPKKASWISSTSLRYLLMALAPITLFFCLQSASLVHLFYAAPYAAASGPLLLLSIAVAFATLFFVIATIAIAIGRHGWAMGIAALAFIITWILLSVLTPAFSLQGAAAATLLGNALAFFLMALALRRWMPLRMPASSLAKIGLASAVFAAVLLVLRASLSAASPLGMLASLITASSCASVAYALVLLISKEISMDDKRRIVRFLPKKAAPVAQGILNLFGEQ